MCIRDRALAEYAEKRHPEGISEDYIVPRMDEWEVYIYEAVACAEESIREGVARLKLSRQELWERASAIIKAARESLEALMEKGIIKPPPPEEELLRS